MFNFSKIQPTALTPIEIGALHAMYRPMCDDAIDFTGMLECVEIEWENNNLYRLDLHWRSKRLPRLWTGVVLKGIDPSGECCARMAVCEFHGVPLCLSVSLERAIGKDRVFDVPVRWMPLYPPNYDCELPLDRELIERFEAEADVCIPEDLLEFLTSSHHAGLSRAIGPLNIEHLVKGSDGHLYYLVFAMAGTKNLFLRLGRDKTQRPSLSDTFLVEENTDGYPPFATGISKAVERFTHDWGEDLYLEMPGMRGLGS